MTATAPNISNDRDSPQAEKNYTAVRYGTDKGSIYFGHIHKNADVTAGVMLSTPTGDHQLSLDISGQREGWTCSTSPGNFQVKCGTDPTKLGYEDENLKKSENVSMIFLAENGDIVIKAAKGKIRMEAQDIEMVAEGPDSSMGNVKITASENIETNATKTLINSKMYYRIATPGLGHIIANAQLNIYAAVWKGISAGCILKDSKVGGQKFAVAQLALGAADITGLL